MPSFILIVLSVASGIAAGVAWFSGGAQSARPRTDATVNVPDAFGLCGGIALFSALAFAYLAGAA
jgi:hypothetical protein